MTATKIKVPAPSKNFLQFPYVHLVGRFELVLRPTADPMKRQTKKMMLPPIDWLMITSQARFVSFPGCRLLMYIRRQKKRASLPTTFTPLFRLSSAFRGSRRYSRVPPNASFNSKPFGCRGLFLSQRSNFQMKKAKEMAKEFIQGKRER